MDRTEHLRPEELGFSITADELAVTTAVETLLTGDSVPVLEQCLGTADLGDLPQMLQFDHIGILSLIDPAQIEAGLSHLGRLSGVRRFPSVIVTARLRERYPDIFAAEDSLAVEIIKYGLVSDSGIIRELEVFHPASSLPAATSVWDSEISSGNECHHAFRVTADTPLALVQSTLLQDFCTPDGGGVNRHEGTTTLYFRSSNNPLQRLEVIAAGIDEAIVTGNSPQL
ncbi:hypothetical protein A2368_03160 [Candidatus Collierbacteria bacterium RIFOXYB1_FULL_49_13]|uniref:Uncharacterized protein n=1 Tax=Candidatus Collierbacteria bacterium RIFOXYB1_FULL_49_13 TaxID=1817728 RepID=A0A1F5FJU2_9BACT|nr:MAG: hypothetical protein A2368_03160 [Candidatus Collierbacteria bacterium RIFOXYB1_FULL_49_13]